MKQILFLMRLNGMMIRRKLSILCACALIPTLIWADDPYVYDPATGTSVPAEGGSTTVPAADTTSSNGTAQAAAPQVSLTPDQLDSLVAPIALYPDPIISQILVAS